MEVPEVALAVYLFLDSYVEEQLNMDITKKQLYERIKSSDNPLDYQRVEAVEALIDVVDAEDEPLLIDLLLTDPDELVRVSATEGLGKIRTPQAQIALMVALCTDRSYLVRGWSAGILADFGDTKLIPLFERLLCSSRSEFVIVNLLYGLWRLGVPDAFERVLDHLNSKSYRIQCAVSNLIIDSIHLLTNAERERAIFRLRSVLAGELSYAAYDSIKRALEALQAPLSSHDA